MEGASNLGLGQRLLGDSVLSPSAVNAEPVQGLHGQEDAPSSEWTAV